uniref:Uncharacterized protein n=1 Tax=viral metagenome TaxID=1070528 RepID=A0A6C0DR77_9ZZZZ
MPKQSRATRRARKSRGGDAWNHAVQVYGDAGHQQATAGSGNLIQSNLGVVAEQSAGDGFTQVAVPGVLLVANQLNTRKPRVSRSNKFRRSRKSRKYRR